MKFPFLPSLSLEGLARGSRTSSENSPHSPPRTRSKANAWKRGLLSAVLALCLGGSAQAADIGFSVAPGSITEGNRTEYRVSLNGDDADAGVQFNFVIETLGNNPVTLEVPAFAVGAPRREPDFASSTSSPFPISVTESRREAIFSITAATDSFSELDEGFRIRLSTNSRNNDGTLVGLRNGGITDAVIAAQSFTNGNFEFSSEGARSVLENAQGVTPQGTQDFTAPTANRFRLRLVPPRQNGNSSEPDLQYAVVIQVNVSDNVPAGRGIAPIIDSNDPRVFDRERSGFKVRFRPPTTEERDAGVTGFEAADIAMTFTGDDTLAPEFVNGGFFQQQVPRVITMRANIVDTTAPRNFANVYPGNLAERNFTFSRFDIHGLADDQIDTNFITSENPNAVDPVNTSRQIATATVRVALRNIFTQTDEPLSPSDPGIVLGPQVNAPGQPYAARTGRLGIPNPGGGFFDRNTDAALRAGSVSPFNTDALPKTDVFLPAFSNDIGEGLISYFVIRRDDTNRTPIFIQSIPQRRVILRFSTDPADPEYFLNEHYLIATGVDDQEQDGDQNYQIQFENFISTDPEFSGIQLFNAPINLRNTDDEQTASPQSPGVVYTSALVGEDITGAAPNLTTSEGKRSDFFRIRLRTQPAITSGMRNSQVRLTIRSSRPDEVRVANTRNTSTTEEVDATTLDFFANNLNEDGTTRVFGPGESIWNQNQTITVIGQDDELDPRFDGNPAVPINVESDDVITNDPIYDFIDPLDPIVTNTDNESRDVTVSTTTLLVDEGTSGTFTVRLNARPNSNVTINLSVAGADANAIRITSPSTLTFTPAEFDNPTTRTKTVTVAGISDGSVTPATRNAIIVTSNTNSSDAGFSNIDVADVNVTVQNTDNAVRVSPSTALVVSESGTTTTFQVLLTGTPAAPVTVTLTAKNPTEARLLVAGALADSQTLTFTPANAATAQTVTVQGVADTDELDNELFRIGVATLSADPTFNAVPLNDVTGTNTNVVIAKGIVFTPATALSTTEAGGIDDFAVALSARPAGNVTVTLTSSDFGEAGLRIAAVPATASVTLTFTPENFSTPQLVSAVGIADSSVDGNQPFTITAVLTGDTGYPNATLNGTNADIDVAPVRPEGATFAPNGRFLVSVPYTFAGGAPLTVRDAFGPASDSLGLRYTLYRFNASEQRSQLTTSTGAPGADFVPMDEDEPTARGEGYLLVTDDATVTMTTPDDDPNVVAGDETSFDVKLFRNPNFTAEARRSNSFNGYNLIGFPFNPEIYSSTSVATVKVQVKGRRPRTFESLRAAAAAGALRGRIFGLDSSGRLRDLGTNFNLNEFSAVFVQTFRDEVTITLRNPRG